MTRDEIESLVAEVAAETLARPWLHPAARMAVIYLIMAREALGDDDA